mmetsp:Transcript_41588/g.98607  ORF Transcript_41588/g.98607 Transcript_41588/m.98607 type:complete len:491 (+) Transcript_41588:4110-5582(+)
MSPRWVRFTAGGHQRRNLRVSCSTVCLSMVEVDENVSVITPSTSMLSGASLSSFGFTTVNCTSQRRATSLSPWKVRSNASVPAAFVHAPLATGDTSSLLVTGSCAVSGFWNISSYLPFRPVMVTRGWQPACTSRDAESETVSTLLSHGNGDCCEMLVMLKVIASTLRGFASPRPSLMGCESTMPEVATVIPATPVDTAAFCVRLNLISNSWPASVSCITFMTNAPSAGFHDTFWYRRVPVASSGSKRARRRSCMYGAPARPEMVTLGRHHVSSGTLERMVTMISMGAHGVEAMAPSRARWDAVASTTTSRRNPASSSSAEGPRVVWFTSSTARPAKVTLSNMLRTPVLSISAVAASLPKSCTRMSPMVTMLPVREMGRRWRPLGSEGLRSTKERAKAVAASVKFCRRTRSLPSSGFQCASTEPPETPSETFIMSVIMVWKPSRPVIVISGMHDASSGVLLTSETVRVLRSQGHGLLWPMRLTVNAAATTP